MAKDNFKTNMSTNDQDNHYMTAYDEAMDEVQRLRDENRQLQTDINEMEDTCRGDLGRAEHIMNAQGYKIEELEGQLAATRECLDECEVELAEEKKFAVVQAEKVEALQDKYYQALDKDVQFEYGDSLGDWQFAESNMTREQCHNSYGASRPGYDWDGVKWTKSPNDE